MSLGVLEGRGEGCVWDNKLYTLGRELAIALNLPWTYEKLHCKEEPYQFSSKEDPSIHEIDTHPVTFIQG